MRLHSPYYIIQTPKSRHILIMANLWKDYSFLLLLACLEKTLTLPAEFPPNPPPSPATCSFPKSGLSPAMPALPGSQCSSRYPPTRLPPSPAPAQTAGVPAYKSAFPLCRSCCRAGSRLPPTAHAFNRPGDSLRFVFARRRITRENLIPHLNLADALRRPVRHLRQRVARDT